MRGLKAFCRVRSYIATARAHDVPVFTALRDAFLDNPAPGASQQPRDRIGQPTRSRTPLNGYAEPQPNYWNNPSRGSRLTARFPAFGRETHIVANGVPASPSRSQAISDRR